MLVWVHSCPQRRRSRETTIRSIEASDLDRFEVHEAPNHRHDGRRAVMSWWRMRLTNQSQLPDDTVIVRLEDDIVVSRHLRHNVEHWAALRQPDFGIGTLFFGGAEKLHSECTSGLRRAVLGYSGTAQAQVYRPRELRRWLAYVETPDSIVPDLAAHAAVWRSGLSIYIHEPPLVTGFPQPSAVTGRFRSHPAAGFDPDWRA